jgi:hypothetical protein
VTDKNAGIQPDFDFIKEWAVIHKIDIEQQRGYCIKRKK